MTDSRDLCGFMENHYTSVNVVVLNARIGKTPTAITQMGQQTIREIMKNNLLKGNYLIYLSTTCDEGLKVNIIKGL